MRSKRLALSAILVSSSTVAFAQSGAHEHPAQADPKSTVAKSDAEKAFEQLKALAGLWEGPLKTDPVVPDVQGKRSSVTLRVTSRGHTLMHDLRVDSLPDNPITMLVVDGDRLLLTHYCDADNRPRMVGKLSPDGNTVEFDFVDVSGKLESGHMHHAAFTIVDANHHTEDWTFMLPGEKPMRAHFDLQRTTAASGSSGN